MRSLGRLHGSRISIRWEGKRERGKTPSKAELQIHHRFPRTQDHEHSPKGFTCETRGCRDKHACTQTRVYTQTHLQTQRQLTAAGSEPHSCVLTHTCSTKARACVSAQAEQAQRYLQPPRGETSPSTQVRDTSHRSCLHTHGDACARSWTHTPPPTHTLTLGRVGAVSCVLPTTFSQPQDGWSQLLYHRGHTM